jgi:hypothetical protein
MPLSAVDILVPNQRNVAQLPRPNTAVQVVQERRMEQCVISLSIAASCPILVANPPTISMPH